MKNLKKKWRFKWQRRGLPKACVDMQEILSTTFSLTGSLQFLKVCKQYLRVPSTYNL